MKKRKESRQIASQIIGHAPVAVEGAEKPLLPPWGGRRQNSQKPHQAVIPFVHLWQPLRNNVLLICRHNKQHLPSLLLLLSFSRLEAYFLPPPTPNPGKDASLKETDCGIQEVHNLIKNLMQVTMICHLPESMNILLF